MQLLSHVYFYIPPQSKNDVLRKHHEFWYFFPHPLCWCIHENEEQVWAQCRSLVQPHIHVEALSRSALRTFVWQPLYKSCISLIYYSGTLRFLVHLQTSSLGTPSVPDPGP